MCAWGSRPALGKGNKTWPSNIQKPGSIFSTSPMDLNQKKQMALHNSSCASPGWCGGLRPRRAARLFWRAFRVAFQHLPGLIQPVHPGFGLAE